MPGPHIEHASSPATHFSLGAVMMRDCESDLCLATLPPRAASWRFWLAFWELLGESPSNFRRASKPVWKHTQTNDSAGACAVFRSYMRDFACGSFHCGREISAIVQRNYCGSFLLVCFSRSQSCFPSCSSWLESYQQKVLIEPDHSRSLLCNGDGGLAAPNFQECQR